MQPVVTSLKPPTLQWNPVADSSFERPSNNAVHRFLDVLQAAGIPASTRITRGAPRIMGRQLCISTHVASFIGAVGAHDLRSAMEPGCALPAWLAARCGQRDICVHGWSSATSTSSAKMLAVSGTC